MGQVRQQGLPVHALVGQFGSGVTERAVVEGYILHNDCVDRRRDCRMYLFGRDFGSLACVNRP